MGKGPDVGLGRNTTRLGEGDDCDAAGQTNGRRKRLLAEIYLSPIDKRLPLV